MPFRRVPGRALVVLALMALLVILFVDLARPNSVVRGLWDPQPAPRGMERLMEEVRQRGEPVRPLPPPR